ncbi:MucR family transcriptional regulator [Sphingomonas sp. RHCKR7]|uniref:MucR family transcriptional regulator n=1 Tax=Sphingomonas folli TaxID=2862497 RepID=UPI001C685B4F|nr:MucR family transcriptional regulator [Sphingomonas folli]MBW6525264.1 MucR family transcriptional regulator [Sphingomonas folli]
MGDENDNVTLATELTVAWLSNPNTRAGEEDVPGFLSSVHRALNELGTTGPAPEASEPAHVGAVSARKSLASDEHIISMIDGKPYKTLRRHLSGHGLTPDQYRQRYGLKADYPMVARAYSEARRSLAVARGLGRKAVAKVEEVVEDTATKVTKGRGKAGKAARETLSFKS